MQPTCWEIGMKLKRTFLFIALTAMLTSTALPASAGYRKRPRNYTTNTAPLISGTPSTSVQATATYTFTPTASDAQNNTLTFSISSKPAWASFSSSTGRLTGSPAAAQVGTYSNITIRVSDGYLSRSLQAFSITVTAAPSSTPIRSAPVISGAPSTSITAGSAYTFTPRASDADGDPLAFSIANKPAWAAFSTATGALTGTPTATQAGTYAGIAISVSDGTTSTSLPAFGIAVNAPATMTGSATLTWSAPSQNTDGSSLTNLAGFKVYHGTSASMLNDIVQLEGAASTAYTYAQLSPGTHYFAIAAYTSNGLESDLSALGSKVIP
ncbi:MAG: putative Ig domain-containing protein [Proteobacteria bacterium]|nr:putative Ig domain-containing protein [Pseudomonadota bacterium]